MELLSCLLLCLESRVAGTHQVANRLVCFVRRLDKASQGWSHRDDLSSPDHWHALAPHCLAETVPKYSTVASHNLLPTEGYEQGRLWDS